jgi:hypothetical protein
MGSTGDPGGASSLALYGPVTFGQASPSLRRQQAAPWGGRGRPLHQHYAQGTPPGQDQLAPQVVLHSTSEYQTYPRPAALAGQPVPAADLG